MTSKYICIVCTIITLASCNKLVDVAPPSSRITSDNVFNSNTTAIAVLNGIFVTFHSDLTGSEGFDVWCGLSADEFNLFNGIGTQDKRFVYSNSLTAINNRSYWNTLLTDVYRANAALEGLNASTALDSAVKQELIGEAEFCRAFVYFYLINLYGDAPLTLTTDYKVNAVLARTPKDEIYQQIITDLLDAQTKLSDKFLDGTLLAPTDQRVRPTKWVATALLARVYLYINDMPKAAEQSSAIIENSTDFTLASLDQAFLKNNSEAIWQLQIPKEGSGGINYTPSARYFILPASGPSDDYPLWLSDDLLASFEPGDQRKINWINSVTVNGTTTFFYPFKYKNNDVNATESTEYETVFRLSEQYLIRADAKLNGAGSIDDAISDLNVIRHRAGLPDYNGPSLKDSVAAAILHERRVEFFTEWGHRWLDLKRTNSVDAVMNTVTPMKGGDAWHSYQALYPIPQNEISYDVFLKQNPGY